MMVEILAVQVKAVAIIIHRIKALRSLTQMATARPSITHVIFDMDGLLIGNSLHFPTSPTSDDFCSSCFYYFSVFDIFVDFCWLI